MELSKTDSSLLVTPDIVPTGTTIPQVPQSDAPHAEQSVARKKPEIYELNISSNITNRFAQNLILSRVHNPEDIAQETVFSVILPETAFITGFTMEIDGKNYTAYIKEKEEAKQVYDQAIASGISAAHVAATARDSSRFTVSVNVEPQGKVAFYLTYEELLKRKEAQYEMIINIHPNQPVPKLNVEVTINEQKPLKFVRTPNLRSGNEITKNSDDLDPETRVNICNDKTAVVTFSPSLEKQLKLAETLGSDKEYGFSGQFVVQYDVERDSSGGQILLNDGYFVHFFAPNEIEPLPKYVVFVLDTSGSMYHEKLNQLKQAMKSIMGELKPTDKFNVVEFSNSVNVWDISRPDTSVSYPTGRNEIVQEVNFPAAVSVNAHCVNMTNDRISEMTSNGGTNIYEALKVALWLVESEKNKNPEGHQPMIIFLTDGEATVGVTNQNEIIEDTSDFNKYKTPIFSLSFGAGADRILLEKLSLRNSAFARHIYEGSDASLQLEDFYKTISSPLLRDVEFKYTPQSEAITKNIFPILFAGGEFIVAGKLSDQEFSENPKVLAHGIAGPIELRPEIINPVSSMERLWAYLTTQQFLEAAKSQNKTLNEKKALDKALKYSFVTSVSSLVVVKPDDTVSSIDTEKADTAKNYDSFGGGGGGGGGHSVDSLARAPVFSYSMCPTFTDSHAATITMPGPPPNTLKSDVPSLLLKHETESASLSSSAASSYEALRDTLSEVDNKAGAEDSILWLHHNIEPFTACQEHWNISRALRLQLFKEHHTDTQKYYNEFPCLKLPLGYQLLESDFINEYPIQHNSLLLKWPDLCTKIITLARSRKDVLLKHLLSEFDCGHLNPTNEQLENFCLSILPLLFQDESMTHKDSNTPWRPSETEIKNSFILHAKTANNLGEVLTNRVKYYSDLGLTAQPVPIIVGQVTNIEESAYYVGVNNILCKVDTLLRAVDLTFKLIHILDAEYAAECFPCWIFIQKGIYNIDTAHDKMYVSVSTVISDLKL